MSHKPIGIATIDHQVTTIRKYENGYYTVEVNYDIKYSSESLEELEKKLRDHGITHSVFDRNLVSNCLRRLTWHSA